MLHEFTRAVYRGSLQNDPNVRGLCNMDSIDGFLCIELHNQHFLVLDFRFDVPTLVIYRYSSDHSTPRVGSEKLRNQMFPANMCHCDTFLDHTGTLMLEQYSCLQFQKEYPNFPLNSKAVVRGVIRISFNGSSLFFNMNSNQCRNFKIAFNYGYFQRCVPMKFKPCPPITPVLSQFLPDAQPALPLLDRECAGTFSPYSDELASYQTDLY